MARSVWKGPFVEESLIKKVEKLKNETVKKPIKTWSRKSTIIPDFVGVSFLIYNGKKFIPITISEDMVVTNWESLRQQEPSLVIHLLIKKQNLLMQQQIKNKYE